MDLSKVGVIGYKGRLGSELINRGCTPIVCDATEKKSIFDAIEGKIFDCVLNAAGYTDVDKCETDIVKCYQVNALIPDNIVECFSCKIVHISSDYLYSGMRGLYHEYEIPEPQSTYGFSKHFGEVPIRSGKNYLIIRTTMLYDGTHEKSNFVRSVYNDLKQNKRVSVPIIYGNPTYIPHLVNGILFSIEQDLHGILNIVGRDWVSRLELAGKIVDTFGFDNNLISEGPAWGEAKRGKYYGLSVEKADILKVPVYSLDDGLAEFGKVMKEKDLVQDESIANE